MGIDPTLSAAATPLSADAKAAPPSSDWDFSFHNLLSIINPLEHLPVIGTIYRAITGTHIGIPERIAGDALYGGLWGAVSGAADAAFEAITGKDFGSTVLALFTGSHKDAAVASNQTPVTPAKFAALSQNGAPDATPDMMALQASLSRKGVDGELAQRAMSAYRKSMMLPSLVPAS
ncbi:MAG TPA: hypothetical protein VGM68_07970 [Rhizomicrobium sp.]